MLEVHYQDNVYQSCLVNFSLSESHFRKRKKWKKGKYVVTWKQSTQRPIQTSTKKFFCEIS